MASIKISDLSSVTTLASSDVLPIVNGNDTKKVSISQLSDKIISDIGGTGFTPVIVQTLPTQDIDTHTIYFVPKTGETGDVYDEWIYINNAWEHIGSTSVDLSNYYTKTEVDSKMPYVLDLRKYYPEGYISDVPAGDNNTYTTVNITDASDIAIINKINTRLLNGDIPSVYLKCFVWKNGNTGPNQNQEVMVPAMFWGYNAYKRTGINYTSRRLYAMIDTSASFEGAQPSQNTGMFIGVDLNNNKFIYSMYSNKSIVTKQYVDDAIAAIPTGGTDSKYIYEGKTSEYTSSNRLSLNDLSLGLHVFFVDSASLLVKATINGTDYNQSITTPYNKMLSFDNLVYILKEQEIPDTVTSDIAFGKTYFSDFTQSGYIEKIGNDISIRTYGIVMTQDILITSNYRSCTLNTAQTISGIKTFTALPETSIAPTTSNQLTNKQYVDSLPTNYSGYDATKTQILKNINGTLTWVDE